MANDSKRILVARHLRVGWWGLALFMTLGIALEVMHAWKLPFYLDVRNEMRHTMWMLAHAHGTLLSLVNIAFALCLAGQAEFKPPALASRALVAGWLLMPLGFFLGGIGHEGGDPGIGVLLAPLGAVLLVLSTVVVAWSLRGMRPEDEENKPRTTQQGKHGG